jgi:GT2 family glycosyltransferase
MTKKPLVTIIIVNYNTPDLTIDCIKSIAKETKIPYEIILVDNASTDDSKTRFKTLSTRNLTFISSQTNLGFAKGNNLAKKEAKGEYVLFLNSDTIIKDRAIDRCLEYIQKNPKTGALTCRLILPNGSDDPDTIRSFPTPWVALTHFSHLDRLFPASKLFSQYWLGYSDRSEIQNVDVIQGAFFLSPKKLLDKVNWFDEIYFLDGEDIDLCYKIKNLGYEIIYYPEATTVHIKKASKKKNKFISKSTGVNSMEIFYKKHLSKKYNFFTNSLVYAGIKTLKIFRLIIAVFS